MSEPKIIFKVWDKENKRMYRPKDICGIYPLITPNAILTFDNHQIFDFILIPFIGRYDKKGDKIFFGDIFKVNSGLWAYIDWNPDEARYCLNFNDRAITNPDAYFEELSLCTIAGNIFENPEIMKGVIRVR